MVLQNEYLDIIVRSVLVYLAIVFFIRLFGKKELAQLSVVDLVFILLISNSVQNAMVGPSTSLYGGLTAALSLFAVNYIFKLFIFRSKKFNEFIQGHSVMLVYKGKVIEQNLIKAKLSHDELDAAIREHGVKSIKDVDLAVFEVDGNISVLSHNFERRTSKKLRGHKVIKKEVS
jgi:uncharacterized membrane protein YcaP (DUF421 family)